jgi:hypothetical protein
LAVAGYVDDTQDYDMPLHERNRRLDLLQTKIEYWKKLDWSQVSSFTMSYPPRYGFQVIQSILMMPTVSKSLYSEPSRHPNLLERLDLSGKSVARTDSIHLPKISAAGTGKGTFPLKFLSADPSQNLLVAAHWEG